MPTALIIPFPGPKGRPDVRTDGGHINVFIDRYLNARAIAVNDGTRAVVARAIAQFPGGLPAKCVEVERFIDFAAGPRLRRTRPRPRARATTSRAMAQGLRCIAMRYGSSRP